jgi:rubrerythrin
MKSLLINCLYCNFNQRVFHFPYNLKKILNYFNKTEIFILGNFKKKQEIIKRFNCNNCSEDLLVCYDIEKSKYFVNGEQLEKIRSDISNKKKGIRILEEKLEETSNKQIKDFLEVKITKVEEELNHLIQKKKELTERAPKEDTQV